MSARHTTALAPPVAGSDWLLGAALIVVVPLLPGLPLWAGAAYLVMVAWRMLHLGRGWPLPGRWLRWAIAAAAIVLVARLFGTLLGRDPGVTLLVLLTGVKLLELRSLRDAVLSALLLLLIVLAGFLYGHTLLLGLYSLLAVVLVTAALIRLQDPGQSARPLLRQASMLVAQALPLMLVAYLLFPRLPDALWALQTSGGGTTGMSERMQPGSVSALSESDEVAFRAYFEQVPPPNRELYWRMRIFWDTDGRAWEEGRALRGNDSIRVAGTPIGYRVVVEPSDKPWLPALDLPLIAPDGARRLAGFIYESRRALRERQDFEFVSYTRYRTGAPSEIELWRALRLPRDTSPRVRALAQSWRAAAVDSGGIVQAALAHFRREPFFYTLTPPPLGADPVDEFLFGTRRGFCEHYAAAFVTLMRAAGVPARVVVGYQGGIYNNAGDYLIVRQADAHAWAEVWLEATGWTRVDPTAAVAPARIEYGIDGVRRLNAQGLPLDSGGTEAILRAVQLPWLDRAWLRTQFAWDYVNFSWSQWVSNYGLERQTRLLTRLGLTNYSIPVMLFILAQLVLLYALIQLRRRPRPRPRDVLRRHYEKYCRKLARAGIERGPAEGPVALAERARAVRPDLARAIGIITERYVAVRYGLDDTAAARREFARAVRAFRP